jgi:hypothetical protein
MANLSIAFSIFDVFSVAKVADVIVAGAQHGLREAAEQGVRGAARSTVAAARRAVLENLADEVLENALRQAVTEGAIVAATTVLLPDLVRPVLVPWMREVAAEHGTLPEVEAALRALTAGPGSPPAALPAPGSTTPEGTAP